MQIGKLRHAIELQQEQRTPDGGGGFVRTWQTVARVRAAVEPLTGSERWRAEQVQANVSHRVTIRYRPGITTDMRVKFGARVFLITAVIDPEERHRELQLLCTELMGVT